MPDTRVVVEGIELAVTKRLDGRELVNIGWHNPVLDRRERFSSYIEASADRPAEIRRAAQQAVGRLVDELALQGLL